MLIKCINYLIWTKRDSLHGVVANVLDYAIIVSKIEL